MNLELWRQYYPDKSQFDVKRKYDNLTGLNGAFLINKLNLLNLRSQCITIGDNINNKILLLNSYFYNISSNVTGSCVYANGGECIQSKVCNVDSQVIGDIGGSHSAVYTNKGYNYKNWLLDSSMVSNKGEWGCFITKYGNCAIKHLNISDCTFIKCCGFRTDNDGKSDTSVRFLTFMNSTCNERMGISIYDGDQTFEYCNIQKITVTNGHIIYLARNVETYMNLFLSNSILNNNIVRGVFLLLGSQCIIKNSLIQSNDFESTNENYKYYGEKPYSFDNSHLSMFECEAQYPIR